MNSKEIRQTFLDFFASKGHEIVPSAPMVVKNDPTLMFTNAGMNQFKDIFLGNSAAKSSRVADTQKCLRVSGKHNDLEEVGHDTYHHTMFEMLGNWSFGDYFKEDAINWAWELLVEKFGVPADRLYVTVYEGSKEDGVSFDQGAYDLWENHLPASRIINGNKKDNFWEMGETGPCGPCSEIHIDIRSDEDRAKVDGLDLVNQDHPQVIEIWNLVFMQYNRKADGSLEPLPKTHVDTGMGFERLCMVLQGKQSNYDTDLFTPLIGKLEALSGKKYGEDEKVDIAMRVISDHIRTVAFAIADAQLPSNNKAGYVIRRILRRAVRYGYTFLGFRKAFMFELVDNLSEEMGEAFPEIVQQKDLIMKVTKEEEDAFLRTLETGIRLLDRIVKESETTGDKVVKGTVAFELYDTYGFPLDLTELIARENDMGVDIAGFNEAMEVQKSRSRNAASQELSDWTFVSDEMDSQFVGYDATTTALHILRYRQVKQKKKSFYQVVFDVTPFYGESGGQVGDTGYIEVDNTKYSVVDTKKENNLTVHIMETLPENVEAQFVGVVDMDARLAIANNHTATHILDHALRRVLGTHVEQKGSLVTAENLRFDFSHFQKVTDEELIQIQQVANEMIRANFSQEEFRSIPMSEAEKMGAIALFGEKYGDDVRVIKFGESIELCGGTHTASTGQIGSLVVVSESSISAGVRRIEAITAKRAEAYHEEQSAILKEVKALLNNPKDVATALQNLLDEQVATAKMIESFQKEAAQKVKRELLASVKEVNGMNLIEGIVAVDSAGSLKDIAFQLKGELDNLCFIVGADLGGKPNLTVMISDNLVKDKGLNAGQIIREVAKKIQGGGGGQPFFATAGGKNVAGLPEAIADAVAIVCK
ncbi:alanine--tRNA ligase [Halosquirtibacter xylanolyticus]|uniref:alanine--tRNA ligase n=1 Tax=Halosquirtibacter xylanolyticus TaxID=3374599 RepID=UPI00374A6EDA|nr:alanine--tRNA ligase [Prolixibacteraceae bacterium]